MANEAKTTTDHDAIRKWAESRGGRPAAVAATHGGKNPGIIRIAFQDESESLEDITWDELFSKFEENKLAFLHQDQTKDGEVSRFFKFVKR
ncbi:MAG: hypothetical protein MUD06_07495 [Rhodospirillales bacterium]|jgi:hypothetical protein|nr:hypothetical protein [Rhodospirillales bacterium]